MIHEVPRFSLLRGKPGTFLLHKQQVLCYSYIGNISESFESAFRRRRMNPQMSYDKPEHVSKLAGGASFDQRYTLAREIPEMILRSGRDFAKRDKVKIQSDESWGSGITELSGTVQCGFGILHRPGLTLTRRDERLLVERYRCGCREGSRDQFCVHSAALLAARFPELEARLPEDTQNPAEADMKGIRIRLGTHIRSREPIYWTPEDQERLATSNLAVIGGADTGNTQVMKSIALQFLRQRETLPEDTGLLILDWMGDYDESKTDFLEATGARVRKLPTLSLDPFSLRQLERKPQLHMHRAMAFADILAKSYGLGPLQKSTLVQSVLAAYEAKGITSDPLTWNRNAPSFTDVYEEYNSRPLAQRNESLSLVMDTLASFELFDSDQLDRTTTLEMFRGVVVIDMSGYPRELKSFAAGIMLEQLYAQMCASRRRPSGYVSKMLMIDEVDDLLAMGSPGLEGILKRSREHGLSVVLTARSPEGFCSERFDWQQVIRSWVIHNAETLFKPELDQLLQLDAFDAGAERLYQAVKHQHKLESLIRIGTEETVQAEDLAFYEIVRDTRQSYLVEQSQEIRTMALEGMPLLDMSDLGTLEDPDEIPALPMAELTEI